MYTFPMSPLPATLTRFKDWNSNNQVYDSGDQQGLTNWARPLYRYAIPFKLLTEINQSSLWSFFDKVRQTTDAFLMKDPYDFRVNSVMGVRSGISTSTLYLYDTNSYYVRADTTSIGSLFSVLSGYVRLGTEYQYEQDTGILTITTKSNTDSWGVRSMQYFKKVKLTSPVRENDLMWNAFSYDDMNIEELP